MKTFKLPKNIRFAEHCGLDLRFQETCLRGEMDMYCQVVVVEEGLHGFYVTDPYTYEFTEWEDMKKAYPTLMDFLLELSRNQFWNSDHIHNDRIYYIRSMEGHEGLYDEKKVVWFDALVTN